VSSIGSPIETSLLQAAQAQQMASKARDREKAVTEGARRHEDMVDLRVAGVETEDAVRRLPRNDSPEAGIEHRSQERMQPQRDVPDRPRVDVQA
jgi:hypothetical protein